MILLVILILLFIVIFNIIFPKPQKNILNVYFGVPGSGKTTFAAYLSKQSQNESIIIKYCRKHTESKICQKILSSKCFKRAVPVYSNVPITGTYKLDVTEDIGKNHIENGKIIIDEAGIEYNNRNYKNFPAHQIYFYKYHRHYKTSIDVFSQSYDDMDITLRRLAQNFYVVKRSIIPYCIKVKLIKRKIGIDEKHQICDMYDFGFPVLDSKIVYCPPLWKLFNSYSRKQLDEKEWEKW